MQNIWMRLGVTLTVFDEEARHLMPDEAGEWDPEKGKEVLSNILKEGRFAVDGHSYIPSSVIDSVNEKYGTSYSPHIEPEWDF